MSNHTQETLDALRLKSDVAEVAEGLGLSTEGTRKELTEAILSHQEASSGSGTEGESSEAGSSGSDESTEGSGDSVSGSSDDESPSEDAKTEEGSERARDDGNGQFTPDDPATQPNEAYDPPKPVKVTPRAKKVAGTLVASYLGQEAYTAEVESQVVQALNAGKQPCILSGTGNVRFVLEVVDSAFNAADVSKDARAPKERKMLANIARKLADANLYPTRA